jgi:hypothetical protein
MFYYGPVIAVVARSCSVGLKPQQGDEVDFHWVFFNA